MENLGEFVASHWLLTALFVLLSLALLFTLSYVKLTGVSVIYPAQAVLLVNQQKGFFLDVREAPVFAKAHIVDAVNMPLSVLPDRVAKLKFTGQPVILVCEAGQSIGAVAKQLRSKGFVDIYILKDGINSWRDAKLPLFN